MYLIKLAYLFVLSSGWLISDFFQIFKSDALTLTSGCDMTSAKYTTNTSGLLNFAQSFWIILSWR